MPRVSFFFSFPAIHQTNLKNFKRKKGGNAFLLNGGNGGMELRRDEKQEL